MEWADALIWSTVMASPKDSSDSILRERLYHIHCVQHAFLQIWKKEELDLPGPDSFQDTASLQKWAREYYYHAKHYFSMIEETTLEHLIQLPWRSSLEKRYDEVHPVTLANTVIQVATHTIYHRGQINTRLREIGGTPPLTDFIAWIWSGKPGPDWPE